MPDSSDNLFLDRRRFPRYPCTGDAEILQGGSSWGSGVVSDISLGGCYIETTHPLSVGAEVQLRLTIAGVFLDICANVVSSDPMYGMGMNFVVVPIEQWNKLPLIIEEVAAAGSSTVAKQQGTSHEEAQSHMQSALQLLELARKEMQEAMHSRDGRRTRALQLTDAAIDTVKKTLALRQSDGTMDPASVSRELRWSSELQ
jgi:hypothetical protein